METHPLQECRVQKWSAIIHRAHTLIHTAAMLAMLYYRLITISFSPAWFLVFASELILSFLCLLNSAHLWRPVSRSVFTERLPPDDELPAIDVFVCTADPEREPPLGVMNTVLSAMALDYPPEKISVYLSDDGASCLTLYAIRETWRFAEWWVPFCRKYGVRTTSPQAYFQGSVHEEIDGCDDLLKEREMIQKEYDEFKARLGKAQEYGRTEDTATVKIIGERGTGAKIPLLVYVSREKNPAHPHHFKAGALNVLLRVSGIISNSLYILMLDCDMQSNDSSSARQAMCFHLDPDTSPSLAFVQFPQLFHNVSNNDIYDSALRAVFTVKWPGMDGLIGPMLSGTCFYMKRKALYGTTIHKGIDLCELKKCFGTSNEFLNTLINTDPKQNDTVSEEFLDDKIQEAKFLASSTYELDSQWGEQVGFMYHSVVEDYFTGFILHGKGWKSVFCNPSRPAFLGSTTTNLNDTLVQGTRWNSGLLQVLFSRFCPLIYGFRRMPLLECMCYAYLAAQPLYCFPAWSLAIIPQLCLLNGIPIYPKVSSPWFMVYSFLLLSVLTKYLWDVVNTGGTTRMWWNEWRVWMIKSITAYFYGTLDVILELVGFRKVSFLLTNKAIEDDEQLKRYQMGVYDFQESKMLLVPLVTLVILNITSFVWGTGLVVFSGTFGDLFGQVFLSFFIVMVNYPFIEGMIFRKDKGSIPLSVTLLSILLSFSLLFLGSIFLM